MRAARVFDLRNRVQQLNYFNLVYANRPCNSVKLDQLLNNPLAVLPSESIVLISATILITLAKRSSRARG